jgi:hypothetical protein
MGVIPRYFETNDEAMQEFVSTGCCHKAGAVTTTAEMSAAYEAWNKARYERGEMIGTSLGVVWVGRLLARVGVKRGMLNGRTVFRGIAPLQSCQALQPPQQGLESQP